MSGIFLWSLCKVVATFWVCIMQSKISVIDCLCTSKVKVLESPTGQVHVTEQPKLVLACVNYHSPNLLMGTFGSEYGPETVPSRHLTSGGFSGVGMGCALTADACGWDGGPGTIWWTRTFHFNCSAYAAVAGQHALLQTWGAHTACLSQKLCNVSSALPWYSHGLGLFPRMFRICPGLFLSCHV